jgi:hypothetical protein
MRKNIDCRKQWTWRKPERGAGWLRLDRLQQQALSIYSSAASKC